jgi:hypothetical protein
MRLVMNFIVQTTVWFVFMGAIIFGAAGTIDYLGGWLYLAEMIAISVVLGVYFARIDPGLLRERLKPPIQKDQPLADKLIVIPLLLLLFGGMGFMAADAARWRWSTTPPSVQWAGCVLLFAAILFMSWTMRTNSFAAPVVKIQKERGQTVITTRTLRDRAPPALFRRALLCGCHVARSRLVVGLGDGAAGDDRIRIRSPPKPGLTACRSCAPPAGPRMPRARSRSRPRCPRGISADIELGAEARLRG